MGCENVLLSRRDGLEKIGLMADESACLPKADALNNKRCGLIQSAQGIFTLAMQHIVNAGVIDVACADFD